MNDIGDDGAFQIAAALKDNRSLTSLDLGGNNVGPDGAKALAAALQVRLCGTLQLAAATPQHVGSF